MPTLKHYAKLGYLEPLDSYLATSQEVVIEDMWETSVNRFKYDVKTTTQEGPDSHYWGIPKDIGPTVIYYNETYFNEADVTVISVAADDLDDFNNGGKDSRGKTKADYGITGTVKEKGYFELDGKKWFNNQVPMSWDECVTLSTLVQTVARTKHKNDNIYGYFTEWWFNYGWSVGGDCIEYVETDDTAYNGGYWDFTLMDNTKNYIVADDNTAGYDVNGNHYDAGEIIAWADKLADTKASNKTVRPEVKAAAESGKLNELPSQREGVRGIRPYRSEIHRGSGNRAQRLRHLPLAYLFGRRLGQDGCFRKGKPRHAGGRQMERRQFQKADGRQIPLGCGAPSSV